MVLSVKEKHIVWNQSWRVIHSHGQEKHVLNELAQAPEQDVLIETEQITNNRIQIQEGHVPSSIHKKNFTGPGSQYILAPFSFPNPDGSRFSDGTYGVYYAGHSLITAIKETVHHLTRFLKESKAEPEVFNMRVLVARLDGSLHDIRGMKKEYASVYDPASYVISRTFGKSLYRESSNGIIYDSVRDKGGECVAVFKPDVLNHCRQERFLEYVWDGDKIKSVYELKEFPQI